MSDVARPLASRPVPRTVRSARRWLRALHDELGVAGLAAAAALPGLAAVCALSTRPGRVGSTDLPPWPRTITPPST